LTAKEALLKLRFNKIWPDFGRLQTSAANIFGTNKDIQKMINTFCILIPLALDEKSSVNFGPLITEI